MRLLQIPAREDVVEHDRDAQRAYVHRIPSAILDLECKQKTAGLV